MLSLGALIRENRLNKRITVRKFAQKIGVSASFINDLENGIKKPSVIQYEKIIVILDIRNRAEIDELHSKPLGKRIYPKELKTGLDGKNRIVIALRVSDELELNEIEWFEFHKKIVKEENKC